MSGVKKVDNGLLACLTQLFEGGDLIAHGLNEEELKIVQQAQMLMAESRVTKEKYESLKTRLEELLDVLVEFAQFNFDMEIPLSDQADELDGIALGLQTLGQEVEYYQSQLELSNQNLKEAQEMANIGSWEINVETSDMLLSDQMYRIYGLERNGKERENLENALDHKDRIVLTNLYNRAVEYHEPYKYTHRVKVNGEVKFIDAQAKPVLIDGKVVKLVGTAMDVTERILAQKKLEQLNQELEQKVVERTKDLEGFSYTVSHDLRAPLRSITGFSNILDENFGPQLPDEARRLLSIIVKNASKMSTLIEELLTFSRVGVTVARFERIDLNAVVDTAWSEALNNFGESEKVSIQKIDLPEVYGTKTMMYQVFLNLFSNALKYSSKKEQIVVEIGLQEIDDKKATIFVRDNGCGFDMKYHDKLFGVFQRLHSEDEFSGTGVGLALVKRIMDKHQGSIRAESEVDKGSTFILEMPVQPPIVL